MTVETSVPAYAYREVVLDSHEYLETALRAFPQELYPHGFKVIFSATDREFDRQEDFARAENILPGVRLILEWDPNRNIFVPSHRFMEVRDPRLADTEEFRNLVLAGSKPQEIELTTSYHTSDALKKLLETEVDRIPEAGYHLHEAELRIREGNHGPRSRAILKHSGQKSSVILHNTGAYLKEEETAMLDKWLGELVKLQ